MKILKKILLILLFIFIVIQFFKPNKNEGNLESVNTFLAETRPTAEVASILKESCFDCHSDNTRYPWYNKITPVNYWLNNHVKHGKTHLNFSRWEGYSVQRKIEKFEEITTLVKAEKMPLPVYTYLHSEAQLSALEVKEFVSWSNQNTLSYNLMPKPQ